MATCKGCGGMGRTGITKAKCQRCDGSGKCTVCKGSGRA